MYNFPDCFRAFLGPAILEEMAARLLLVAALACLRAASAGYHDPPHPLYRFLLESFAVVIDPTVSMTLNSTVQSTTNQNFLLTIKGISTYKG